jgi:hypothetical protein
MNNYHFETREFGISDTGIHLLRSGFNYETIEFFQIERLTIEKGKELNNWIAILVVGLMLISFSLYYSFRLFSVVSSGEVNVVYIEEVLVPLFPFLIGAYCLYSSTRNGTILQIETVKKTSNKYLLKELERNNSLQSFQEFLKGRLGGKVSVNLNLK